MRTWSVRGSPFFGRGASSVAGNRCMTCLGCTIAICWPPHAAATSNTKRRMDASFPVDPRARKPHDARVTRLLLDEHILADGRVARTWASRDGDRLRVAADDAAGGRPARAPP